MPDRAPNDRDSKERLLRNLERQVRVLERERRKFVAVVEQSGARVFVAGADLKVRWTNSTLASSPPAPGASWIGRECRQLCARALDSAEGCGSCPIARAFERNENTYEEFQREHPDGERTYFVSALPIHTPDGRPEEVMMSIQDLSDLATLRSSEARNRALLSESRRVEAELRHIQQRLTIVLSNAPIVLFAIDKAGVFTMSEGRGLERLGLQRAEVVGREVWDVYKDHPAILESVKRALAGEAFSVVSEVGPIAFDTHYAPIRDRDGNPAGTIGVAFDCTERLRLEGQLIHGQRMEAMGLLASGVAHDFNNLLAVILGHAELMIARLEERHPLWHHADEVQKAAVRGASLTRQLLAFSRKDVGTPRDLDVGMIVSGTLGMLRRLIGEHIEVVTLVPAEPVGTRAERGSLEQIILNLAVNARDAMPEGGRLEIDVDGVALDATYLVAHADATTGRHVCITVRDTGSGMTPEVQARAFEPFFTTKPIGTGSGLGLSTVYGIVRGWGGHVTIESAPGRGATVRVYLPRVPLGEPGSATKSGAARPGSVGRGDETVLLVEDEVTVRQTARQILTARGYRVLEAGDGVEALERAAAHDGEIHLLVTDVVMPNLGGGELARRLVRERPGIRVLFVSGYAADERVREGVADASVRFLQKPFSVEALAGAVREALDGPAPGSQSEAA
jgi:PAS domain S-box-containing protein